MSETTTMTTPRARGPSAKQLAIVVALMAAGILVTALTSDVTKTSEPGIRVDGDKPSLAADVGNWHGGAEQGLSENEIKILPKDTQGARRLFTSTDGRQMYCSIILSGRDVTSIHRPELCLPGQGLSIQSQQIETIPVPSAPGGQLQVMRLNTVRDVRVAENEVRRLHAVFVYWFVGKDRLTADHWQRIWWTTLDRVFHNTNHRWAYILVHMPAEVAPGQADVTAAEDAAMKRAAQFVADLYPMLLPQPATQ